MNHEKEQSTIYSQVWSVNKMVESRVSCVSRDIEKNKFEKPSLSQKHHLKDSFKCAW